MKPPPPSALVPLLHTMVCLNIFIFVQSTFLCSKLFSKSFNFLYLEKSIQRTRHSFCFHFLAISEEDRSSQALV